MRNSLQYGKERRQGWRRGREEDEARGDAPAVLREERERFCTQGRDRELFALAGCDERARGRACVDLHVSHDLPPVHRDDPLVASSPAAAGPRVSALLHLRCPHERDQDAPDVDHEPVLADLLGESSQPVLVKLGAREQVRGDDDLRAHVYLVSRVFSASERSAGRAHLLCSCIEPLLRVRLVDAAADLEAICGRGRASEPALDAQTPGRETLGRTRPSLKRRASRVVVARAQLDDVPAAQGVLAVQVGVEGARLSACASIRVSGVKKKP